MSVKYLPVQKHPRKSNRNLEKDRIKKQVSNLPFGL